MKTVIEMARIAGVRDDGHRFEFSEYKYLERFAELVRADAIAAEREACAKVCEDDALSIEYGERSKYRQLIAAVIRARSEK